MNVAKSRRVVSSNRKQRQLWRKPPPDFAKTGKISCISGMINRMLPCPQNKASVAAMRVLQNARAPMPRRNMRHHQAAMSRTLPPVEFNDLGEVEIGNQIGDMRRNHDRRRPAPRSQIVLHDCAKRRTVQMIKMSVRNQNQVDRRQIADSNSRPPQTLQYEQPVRKIRVDDHALSADLQKETGMPDEGHTQLSVRSQPRFMTFARARRDRRVAHQPSKLRCAFAKGPVTERCLNHAARRPAGSNEQEPPAVSRIHCSLSERRKNTRNSNGSAARLRISRETGTRLSHN